MKVSHKSFFTQNTFPSDWLHKTSPLLVDNDFVKEIKIPISHKIIDMSEKEFQDLNTFIRMWKRAPPSSLAIDKKYLTTTKPLPNRTTIFEKLKNWKSWPSDQIEFPPISWYRAGEYLGVELLVIISEWPFVGDKGLWLLRQVYKDTECKDETMVELVKYSIRENHPKILEWVSEIPDKKDSAIKCSCKSMLQMTIHYRRKDMILKLFKKIGYYERISWSINAFRNDIPAIAYLFNEFSDGSSVTRWSHPLLNASKQNIKVFKFMDGLDTKYKDVDIRDILCLISAHGIEAIEILRNGWTFSSDRDILDECMEVCTEHGLLECVKYLDKLGMRSNEGGVHNAATKGHLKVVLYAEERGWVSPTCGSEITKRLLKEFHEIVDSTK